MNSSRSQSRSTLWHYGSDTPKVPETDAKKLPCLRGVRALEEGSTRGARLLKRLYLMGIEIKWRLSIMGTKIKWRIFLSKKHPTEPQRCQKTPPSCVQGVRRNIRVGPDERFRLRYDNRIPRTPEQSHATGNPISQRLNAGFNETAFAVFADGALPP